MNKEDAIKKMNDWGSKKVPFLFIIDFEIENCFVESPSTAATQNVLFDFNGVSNFNPKFINIDNVEFSKTPVSFDQYKLSFDFIQDQLNVGNSYLVNLTFPTPILSNSSISDIFHVSKAKYRLLFDDRFVVFSPESFVKISNQKISTYPMKGTIDAKIENAREKLLANVKEQAEHATIVDLLRNDLSRIADDVKVEKFRYIEEINTTNKKLYQVSSEISGYLPIDFHHRLGDIIFEMLPAGSISGAPKKKTLDIIRKAEMYERGFYTGVAGFFDGENLDSCVLIRFIEQNNGQLTYKSGGGITAKSSAIDEYQELIDKIYVPIS